MLRVIVSVGSILFFALLGGTAVGGVRQGLPSGSEGFTAAAQTGVSHKQVKGMSNSSVVVPTGGISPEERERREAACQRVYESDMDWCWTTTKNIKNKAKRDRESAVCRQKAAQKMAECQARIDN